MQRTFSHILSSTTSKIFSAGITFLLILLGSRELGATGMGEVSLVILAVTLSNLPGALFSGGNIVYLTSRYPLPHLFWLGTIWGISINTVMIGIFYLAGLFPAAYLTETICIGMAAPLGQLSVFLLLGKQKIYAQSAAGIFQSLLQCLFVLAGFYIFSFTSVSWYLWGYGIYHFFPWIFAVLFFRRSLFIKKTEGNIGFTAWKVLQQNGPLQLAAGAQLLNYRLGYYFVEYLMGTAALGVLSVGVQVSEGVLVLARSLASVLSSRVANEKNDDRSSRLTILFLKGGPLITATCFTVLILVFFTPVVDILGPDFSQTPWIMLGLLPGIIFLSANIMTSTYFSGTGKPWINFSGSVYGLIATVITGYPLVYTWGIYGAVAMMTCSYGVSFIFSQYMFLRDTKKTWRSVWFSGSDENIWTELRSRFFQK